MDLNKEQRDDYGETRRLGAVVPISFEAGTVWANTNGEDPNGSFPPRNGCRWSSKVHPKATAKVMED